MKLTVGERVKFAMKRLDTAMNNTNKNTYESTNRYLRWWQNLCSMESAMILPADNLLKIQDICLKNLRIHPGCCGRASIINQPLRYKYFERHMLTAIMLAVIAHIKKTISQYIFEHYITIAWRHS